MSPGPTADTAILPGANIEQLTVSLVLWFDEAWGSGQWQRTTSQHDGPQRVALEVTYLQEYTSRKHTPLQHVDFVRIRVDRQDLVTYQSQKAREFFVKHLILAFTETTGRLVHRSGIQGNKTTHADGIMALLG